MHYPTTEIEYDIKMQEKGKTVFIHGHCFKLAKPGKE